MHEKLSPDRGLDHGFDHGLDHGLGAGRALNGTSAREVAMKSTFVPVLSFEGVSRGRRTHRPVSACCGRVRFAAHPSRRRFAPPRDEVVSRGAVIDPRGEEAQKRRLEPRGRRRDRARTWNMEQTQRDLSPRRPCQSEPLRARAGTHNHRRLRCSTLEPQRAQQGARWLWSLRREDDRGGGFSFA